MPEAETSDRGEVGVSEAVGDPGGLGERLAGRHRITAIETLECAGHQQVAPLDAIVLPVVEQSGCPREPSAAAGELALVEQSEPEPERVPRGPDGLAQAEGLVVGASQEFGHVVVATQQVRRDAQPLEVRELEHPAAVDR